MVVGCQFAKKVGGVRDQRMACRTPLRKHYRCGGIEVTRGRAGFGVNRSYRQLADLYCKTLSAGVAGGVGDCQYVGS